jgi:hypothetical protein
MSKTLLKILKETGLRFLDPAGAESNLVLAQTGKQISKMMQYFSLSNPEISAHFNQENSAQSIPLPKELEKHRLEFEEIVKSEYNKTHPQSDL